jgi:dihydroorotase
MMKIKVKKPNDLHAHLREEEILKGWDDITAVRAAAMSGDEKFFFGSDSAPHPKEAKQKNPPAAGIFSPACVSIPHVWQIFHEQGASKSAFEKFMSTNSAGFYRLPINDNEITLGKKKWTVPQDYNDIVPFLAGKELGWRIVA